MRAAARLVEPVSALPLAGPAPIENTPPRVTVAASTDGIAERLSAVAPSWDMGRAVFVALWRSWGVGNGIEGVTGE